MAVSLTVVDLKNEGPLCGLCNKNFAKYTCPKCNSKYCSTECYKSEKHSICSEQFYKDSFMEALSQQDSISSNEKNKMMKMLKNLEDEDSDNGLMKGDQDGPDLQERMSGLDLDTIVDPDHIWDRLTVAERMQFNRMVQSGELAQLIEDTVPWWRKFPKIQLLRSDDDDDNNNPVLPSLPNDLPPFSTLVKDIAQVSPCVQYNVINVLYCYVYTVKLFNCDHHNLSTSAVEVLLKICSVLSDNLSFSTPHDAIDHPIAIIHSTSDLTSSKHYCLSLLEDVVLLLEPRSVANGHVLGVHGMCDILALLDSVNSKRRKKGQNEEWKDTLSKQKCFQVYKKVQYLFSWCRDIGRDILPHSIPTIRLIQTNSR